MIEIDFHIVINKWKELQKLLQKNFRMLVNADFLMNETPKKHNLLNHIYWFKNKIKYNQQKETIGIMTKRSIYYVDYGINI